MMLSYIEHFHFKNFVLRDIECFNVIIIFRLGVYETILNITNLHLFSFHNILFRHKNNKLKYILFI